MALRALGVFVGPACLVAAALAANAWTAIGDAPDAAARQRFAQSPQWRDNHFVNAEPLRDSALLSWASLRSVRAGSDSAVPPYALQVPRSTAAQFATAPATGLRVTWFGHSSSLVELGSARILVDPIWSTRASPSQWLGPGRWFWPPIALDALPPIDAVVVSHDHYDHLDYATIVALTARGTIAVVPLGVGARLASWGIPASRIVELDWWQRWRVRDVDIVSTPARHASGRTLTDRDATLWAGYALVGQAHRVYYSGDTGFTPQFAEIGTRLGPFDITLIQIGEYHERWRDWHTFPDESVRAHQLVRGRVMLPVHWGLFNLALHAWDEPIERTLTAARDAGVVVATPRPGESVVVGEGVPQSRWWTDRARVDSGAAVRAQTGNASRTTTATP